MIEIDPSGFYTIQDQVTNLFYTAVYGDLSSKLEAVHNAEQSRNCKQSWVKLLKSGGGICITWNNNNLSEKFRVVTDKVILSHDENSSEFFALNVIASGEASSKIKFVKVPTDLITKLSNGFQDSIKFPTEVKMTIDEAKDISVIGNILYPGIHVPVKIQERNNVSTLNFGGKFLTLKFPTETIYQEMKDATKTISYNSSNTTIQYTLEDQVEEQGVHQSSLFRILEIELDSIYRIENFHFPGTYLNISDDYVFYPSILTGTESEIEIFTDDEIENAENTEDVEQEEVAEMDKLYKDLELDPATIAMVIKMNTKNTSMQEKEIQTTSETELDKIIKSDKTKVFFISVIIALLLYTLMV